MSARDRRGSKAGSPAPKPDVPWLKDRPDLHRAEEDDTDLLSTPDAAPDERTPPTEAPDKAEDQRVPGSERRESPPQSGVPGVQGDATKARRRPS
jgi:hypothetical protein